MKKKNISFKRTVLIIILINIIAFSLLYIVKVYSLNEFIDDYENENYIQAKNNVVRNITYNCMELKYVVGGNYENFTDENWIEEDPNNRITISSSRVTFIGMTRLDDAWVVKDKGVDYFDDFDHYLDFYIDSSSDYALNGIWCIANNIEDQVDLSAMNEDYIVINIYDAVSYKQITLMSVDDGVVDKTDSYLIILDKTFYLRIKRDGSATVNCDMYNSTEDRSLEQNAIANLSIIPTFGKTKFRYVYAFISQSATSGLDRPVTGYVENLILDEVSGYKVSGYFYTKEFLSSLNDSNIVLLTNYSSNTGSITVEFSSDNSTWKNHNNQTGSDSMIEGYDSLDLRDLNYTKIYMRFNYTRGTDVETTPRLYQIRIINSEEIINEEYGALFIVGICIGLIFLSAGLVKMGI